MPRTKKSVQTKRKQRKARGGDNGLPEPAVVPPAVPEATAPEVPQAPAPEVPPQKPWWKIWGGKTRKSRKNHKKSVKGKSKK